MVAYWSKGLYALLSPLRQSSYKLPYDFTEYGRCSRTLFIVEKQRLLIKKKDIQVLQQKDLSPRHTYQSAMGKQAMGIYVTNYQLSMDTLAYVLYYPQKPLVTTRAMVHLHFRQLPAGINAIVAIACFSGYNQEDSVVVNQSSVDRGFFRSLFFRSYRDEEKKMGTLVKEDFGRPDRANTMGTRVSGEDVIIGKTTPIAQDGAKGQASRYTKCDHSTSLRHNDIGTVLLTTNADGLRFMKVRVRSVRIPQNSNKFSSRHGQKGTVGMTYMQEDMPWTVEGITLTLL
ncbi:DNA-directed RNA polymerase II subunit RPB2-like [Cornus florida]|uniref:DNA-directed RNA polymerase II subunit RPB2-like n=1 Tax=Cornus florida TaxID=4283 RepID=UPI0028A113D3|nr:DNA-directed RNA polymerase II subunit RPB2-like [Cornus florida]